MNVSPASHNNLRQLQSQHGKALYVPQQDLASLPEMIFGSQLLVFMKAPEG